MASYSLLKFFPHSGAQNIVLDVASDESVSKETHFTCLQNAKAHLR